MPRYIVRMRVTRIQYQDAIVDADTFAEAMEKAENGDYDYTPTDTDQDEVEKVEAVHVELEGGGMIRWLVGNCHVADGYLAVVRHVLSKMKGKRKAFLRLPRKQRREILREILRSHYDNRKLYREVMG